jgi:dTMP kinase
MRNEKRKRGILISFEGTEGSGKSTLTHTLSALLKNQGYSVTLTREPGGTEVAEKIRTILLNFKMAPWTELFLYEAARVEHLEKVILPALAQNHIVLCDRFTDSTLAYQAHARGLPWKQVKLLNQIATEGVKPDLIVFLDIDPETGLKRAQEHNRFEAEGVYFQKKVRSGFLKARRENPKRWLTLQVKQKTPQELADLVLQKMQRISRG